jgi:hypothetical protein
VLVSRRPGALTAWGNAHLVDGASLDHVVEHVVGDDGVHRVVGLPGDDEPRSLTSALVTLRSLGATSLRLVLPVAGHPTGLPGPTSVSTAAVAAGAAVLTVGPPTAPTYALVPVVAGSGDATVVRWDVLEADHVPAPYGLPTLAEADRGLAEAIAAATSELDALDVARGRDAVGGRLAALDKALRDIALPPSLPARAQRLVATASRLLGVVDLAVETDGAAITADESHRRRAALRPLATAARHALCAGYSAAVEPARGAAGPDR